MNKELISAVCLLLRRSFTFQELAFR